MNGQQQKKTLQAEKEERDSELGRRRMCVFYIGEYVCRCTVFQSKDSLEVKVGGCHLVFDFNSPVDRRVK